MAGERYTVPAMGGVEIEVTSDFGESVIGVVPEVGSVMLPKAALKPITAPLPPEPPDGTVVHTGSILWRHLSQGWVAYHLSDHVRDWPYLVENYRDRWPQSWCVMVPDPFGEPVPPNPDPDKET